MKCGMCSKEAKRLVKRWWQYDSGETFVTWVCEKCSDMHTEMVIKDKAGA